MKSKGPAAESADGDLARLGAELTRLRGAYIVLQGKRDSVLEILREGVVAQENLITSCNKAIAEIDTEGAILGVKIHAITKLLRSAIDA